MKPLQVQIGFLRMIAVLVLVLTYSGWMSTPVGAALEYNERIEFTDDFDSCSGERILVSGTQHIVGRLTTDAKGRLHFGFTRNTYGTGTGYISGEKYILTDAVTRTSFEVVSGEIRTFTEQYQTRLIRQGESVSGDDTLIHFLSIITINPDGKVTTSVEIQSVECQ